jgi:hypothetical protein
MDALLLDMIMVVLIIRMLILLELKMYGLMQLDIFQYLLVMEK